MSATALVQTSEATIAVPVNVDFDTARIPATENGLRIAALATEISAKPRSQGGIKDLAVGRSDSYKVNPYLLHFQPGLNSRDVRTLDNAEHIDALARSIAAVGVQLPLTVFIDDGKLYVSDGHCRLLATLRAIEVYGAEVLSVPVINEPKGTTVGDRVLRQISTGTSKALDIFEVGEAFKKLIALGWNVKLIAERSGVSVAVVTQRIELLSANEATRLLVKGGRLAPTLVCQTLRNTDGDATRTEALLTDALTKAETKGKGRATKGDLAEAAPRASFKRTIAALIEAGEVEHGKGDTVTVTWTKADFELLRKALVG